jgi:hypothetical protein
MVKENIRHFSHVNRKKREIHDWAEAQDPAQAGRAFMLGIPVFVMGLTHPGIAIFRY